jgi:hypothetical protein
MDPYRAADWQALFGMTGAAAAVLTGLLFVSLSLHLDEVAANPVHRLSARNALIGFGLVLATSGLPLIPAQSARWLGVELVLVAAGGGLVIGARARKLGRSRLRVGEARRRVGLAALFLVSVLGAGVTLILGVGGGLFWLAFAELEGLLFLIYQSWSLLLVAADEELAGPRP